MSIEKPTTTVPRDPTGGATYTETGGNGGVPLAYLTMTQVAGLVPLYSCDATECRVNPLEGCCDRLLVFGGTEYAGNLGTYENDINSFLVDVQLYTTNTGTLATTWHLQKCSGADTWTNVTAINNTTYGYHWALGSVVANPTYTGIRVNWGKVLNAFGRGIYRVRVYTEMGALNDCLISAEFELKGFDCDDAHGTIKFETLLHGQIGAYGTKGRVFNMCGFSPKPEDGGRGKQVGWYDSCRYKGFFGYETIAEYIEVMNEYQNGKQERVKDEAVQEYSCYLYYMEKDFHDRFKIYGMMSDVLQVSDYNINNADYNINQLPIVKASTYVPTYQDKVWNPRQKVELKFRNGFQGLIKSICCPSLR